MKISEINGLELYEHSTEGFEPLVHFEGWRVALASPREAPGPVSCMSRHLETDEVFVLLKGGCTIFAGGGGDRADHISAVRMEPFKVYNIRKGTWHARIIDPDSLVLVVENRMTGDYNSESEVLEQPVTQDNNAASAPA